MSYTLTAYTPHGRLISCTELQGPALWESIDSAMTADQVRLALKFVCAQATLNPELLDAVRWAMNEACDQVKAASRA